MLSIAKLTKTYGDYTALSDFSAEIPKGKICGLLGHNGAGKTTLIRCLTRIIKPNQGTISFDGEAFAEKHLKRIGYLPEERGLYRKMRVEEHLTYLGQLRGLPNQEIKAKLEKWLHRFELEAWKNHEVGSLSKGMQQKVQFIASVLHDPEFLILDEPFSGFDPVNAERLKQEILALNKQGCTILFSTHRMESVEELCDHMILLNQSKKVLEGAIPDIKKRYHLNIFEVKGKGNFVLPEQCELVSKEEKDGLETYRLRLLEDISHNQLLQGLMNGFEVHAFEEKLPSIQDIFLQIITEKDIRG